MPAARVFCEREVRMEGRRSKHSSLLESKKYYLVHFPAEKSLAVTSEDKIIGERRCGSTVQIKMGKSAYPAVIEAEGTKDEMDQMEEFLLLSDDEQVIPSSKGSSADLMQNKENVPSTKPSDSIEQPESFKKVKRSKKKLPNGGRVKKVKSPKNPKKKKKKGPSKEPTGTILTVSGSRGFELDLDEESITSTIAPLPSPVKFDLGNRDKDQGESGATKRLEILENKVDILLDRMLRNDLAAPNLSANVGMPSSTQPPATRNGQEYPGMQITPTLQQHSTPVHTGQTTYAYEDDWAYTYEPLEDMPPQYWSATSHEDADISTPSTPILGHHQQQPPIVGQRQTPIVGQRQPPIVGQRQPPIVGQQQTSRVVDRWHQQTPMTIHVEQQQQTGNVMDDQQQQTPQRPMRMDGPEQQKKQPPIVVHAPEQQTTMVVEDNERPKQPQVLDNLYSLPSHHRPPIPIKANDNALPSIVADWDGKKTVQAVIENNHKLAKVSKVSTLAVKIAKEAVFGEAVMRKCTPMGSRELPGLPRNELFIVKQALFDLFPSYWKNSEDFESIWATCIDSIGQACKRLRAKKP